VNLALGIETEVTYDPGMADVVVEINGEPRPDAVVSMDTARELLRLSGRSGGLRVRHRVPVPIGSGFGTSGAAALGVALAGSHELSLGLSPIEAAKVAHRVEVEHRTGLGTVSGQFFGGIEVRRVPGAPGVGLVSRVPFSGPLVVVAVHNGPMKTARMLSDPILRGRVNETGRWMTDRLLEEPTVGSFMKLSHTFTLGLGLMPRRVREGLEKAAEAGLYVGMAMFGRTYFTVVEEGRVGWALDIMERLLPRGRVIVSPLSQDGARLN
jgi:pantoate kinase